MIVPWHQAPWSRFAAVLHAGRMPHAWLLRGPLGAGENAFAEAAARLVLCMTPAQGAPCGNCRSCQLAESGAHPDRLGVGVPEGKREIPVESIRTLVTQATLTRSLAPFKPIIISDADAMGISAANALLKTLEEPPAGTVFLLVTSRADILLPTIRSRCQHLHLPPPDRATALAWLAGQGMDDEAAANTALEAADGAPERALALAQEGDVLAQYERLRKQLSELLSGRSGPVDIAAQWARVPSDSLLGWMLALGNGLVRRCIRGEPAVASLDVTRLYAILDQVVEARRAVIGRTNPNQALMLETLAIAWSRGRTRNPARA